MDTKKLTGMDTTGMAVDPVAEDVARGAELIDRLIGPSDRMLKKLAVRMVSTPGTFSLKMPRIMNLSADDIRRDDVGMEQVRLQRLGLPTSRADAFKSMHLNQWSSKPMNLANPYGEGNHHRISWRRNWDVDREALTATHKPTGFVLAFTPCPEGGYTALPGCELPAFGPDGTLAMAQMFGLRELLKDGWEIFHTVMRKT